jgi:hypothetical protein
MNWDALGSMAELLGAVGVIISLVYLASQVKTNTTTIRASAAKDVYMDWSEFNFELSRHPEKNLIDAMWNPSAKPCGIRVPSGVISVMNSRCRWVCSAEA